MSGTIDNDPYLSPSISPEDSQESKTTGKQSKRRAQRLKATDVQGEWRPRGGRNPPNPDQGPYNSYPTLPPSKLNMAGDYHPMQEWYFKPKSLPDLAQDMSRETPPPPDIHPFAAPSGSKKEFFVRAPENLVSPFKKFPNSDFPYNGPVFPRPKKGWTGNERRDFKQAFIENWRGCEEYSLEQWNQALRALWEDRKRNKTDHWNDFKLPPGVVLGMPPSQAKVEALEEFVMDIDGGEKKDGWVLREVQVGETYQTRPLRRAERERLKSGGK